MATNEIHIRRATFDDYEAVLAISDNIYDGLDYLPTMYHQFLQSKNHVVYVAETDDNKLICLINYRLNSDGKTASAMSGRTRKDYRGKGTTRVIYRQLHIDFPNLSHFMYSGIIEPSTGMPSILKKSKLQYRWNLLLTSIESINLHKVKASIGAHSAAVNFTHSELIDFVTSGCCEEFLRKFATDFIPAADSQWRPVRLCEEDLKEYVARANTLMTFTDDLEAGSVGPTDDLDFPLVAKNSTKQCAKWKREIRALSFSSSVLLKSKSDDGSVTADILFFGKELAALRGHVQGHVRHLLASCGASNVYVHIGFPLDIDRAEVQKQLVTWPGLEIKYDVEAYLVCADYRDVA